MLSSNAGSSSVSTPDSSPDASSGLPVAAIAGADGRLGSRLVDGYRQHGYRVAALTRGSEVEGAQQFTVDVTDEASVEKVFADVQAAFGRMDVFIQTVGGWGMSPFLETSLSDWRSLVELNLTSTFLCFREAARHMRAVGSGVEQRRSGTGRLIAISSRQGAVRGVAQQAAYSASKAGVVRLVEAVAAEFATDSAPYGPTAHVLAPSTILFDNDTDAARASGEGVPVEDLVETCLFLSSPAGASLNGATLTAFGRNA